MDTIQPLNQIHTKWSKIQKTPNIVHTLIKYIYSILSSTLNLKILSQLVTRENLALYLLFSFFLFFLFSSFVHTNLATFNSISGQFNTVVDFCWYTQILEEPLVSRPELTPHALLHPLLGIHQLSSLTESVSSCYPLKHVTKFTSCGIFKGISWPESKSTISI